MKKLISYLVVFLLGWAGAVWSYSDSIYPKVGAATENISSTNSPTEK